ncbi:MAG: ADP-ribosylation factor-directed GTPase activating protein isoform b [Planctomycetes bacterium]|nr:ADP-ribosylation factor-directed GTPase activating protein isoform b [Planctomycetota bacterium]
MSQHLPLRATLALILPILALASAGCKEGGQPASAASSMPLLPPEKLQAELDAVLDFNHENRRLNTQDHAAWQILHGIVAYENEFQIRHNGENVYAVQYLLDGGRLKGWEMEAGEVLSSTGRPGLRAIVMPGSKEGQGHYDQWLGYLSQCGLPADQVIRVNGREFTITDYVAQIEWDVPRNPTREYSWTLMALTAYRPTDHTWIASDEKQWSIEDLVRIEVENGFDGAACGGSHRLTGLTMALNHRLAEGRPITGGWKVADDFIKGAIDTARKHQNPDGSFSSNYFLRPGTSADLASALSTTGHTLEFLMYSLTDEEVREPWVQRSAQRLCEMFKATQDYPLECGGLYHSAHGLVLYRERLFGPRSYDLTPRTASTQ